MGRSTAEAEVKGGTLWSHAIGKSKERHKVVTSTVVLKDKVKFATIKANWTGSYGVLALRYGHQSFSITAVTLPWMAELQGVVSPLGRLSQDKLALFR
ncbi:hypothetical protein F5880DRAFT_1608614 [Lentinula raphanica]|nr:hypothetical protein F5880DRAFT_1608614 [Lentinula raphanica]